MLKRWLLVLALGLLSLSYLVAQEVVVPHERKVAVETGSSAAFHVQNARLNNVVTRNKGKLEERFLLSFQVPGTLESALPHTGIKLTAYNEKGGIFGQHTWALAKRGTISKPAADKLQIVSDVNPALKGANSYSLSLFSVNQAEEVANIDCVTCAGIANDTCGRGKVGGVSCGADGSCSFTCK
ncbi:MAG: hypothetical protein ABR577_18080 [Pyrinomonadaceae bacterium]